METEAEQNDRKIVSCWISSSISSCHEEREEEEKLYVLCCSAIILTKANSKSSVKLSKKDMNEFCEIDSFYWHINAIEIAPKICTEIGTFYAFIHKCQQKKRDKKWFAYNETYKHHFNHRMFNWKCLRSTKSNEDRMTERERAEEKNYFFLHLPHFHCGDRLLDWC